MCKYAVWKEIPQLVEMEKMPSRRWPENCYHETWEYHLKDSRSNSTQTTRLVEGILKPSCKLVSTTTVNTIPESEEHPKGGQREGLQRFQKKGCLIGIKNESSADSTAWQDIMRQAKKVVRIGNTDHYGGKWKAPNMAQLDQATLTKYLGTHEFDAFQPEITESTIDKDLKAGWKNL